jgi:hypothetical protein
MVIKYFIHAFKNAKPIFLRILHTLGKILILYLSKCLISVKLLIAGYIIKNKYVLLR